MGNRKQASCSPYRLGSRPQVMLVSNCVPATMCAPPPTLMFPRDASERRYNGCVSHIRAFTLFELLIVVGIIAVLMVIILRRLQTLKAAETSLVLRIRSKAS